MLAAGERHFANYYAFSHARRVVSLCEEGGEWGGWVERVRKWCLAHPRDISGWGLLVFLLQKVEGGGEVERVVDGVREWTRKFGLGGEGVRWFLDAGSRMEEKGTDNAVSRGDDEKVEV